MDVVVVFTVGTGGVPSRLEAIPCAGPARGREASMGFQFSQSDIQLNNPYPVGQDFRFVYEVDNLGPDDSGHDDHVQIWGSDGSTPVDRQEQAPPSSAGGRYGVFVDVSALAAGYYDVMITLPDGTTAGSTIIVQ
jgi:hypothetical protein